MAPAPTLLEADIRIRHVGCLVAESLIEGAFAAQVSSDRVGDVIVMSGPSAKHVDRFVESVRATQSGAPEVMARSDAGVVIRGRNPESGVVATINRSGCTILWPSAWADGVERYTVLSPDRARLDALVAALSRLGPVTLEQVREVTPSALSVNVSLASLTEGFTRKQLEVLQLAVREGYYESPRRTDTVTLASTTGTSRSTFEEHLRKAERRALERFAGAVAAHPALASPTGKPGRPPSRKAISRSSQA